MPTKATTEAPLKRVIARPSGTGVSAASRKQSADSSSQSNASAAKPSGGSQRAPAPVKRTAAPSRSVTQTARASETSTKARNVANSIAEAGEDVEADSENANASSLTENNNESAKTAAPQRTTASSKPAPRSSGSVSMRPSQTAAKPKPTASQLAPAQRTVRRNASSAREDATGAQKTVRASSVHASGRNAPRGDVKTSAKVELQLDATDGESAGVQKLETESDGAKVEQSDSESANPASSGSRSPAQPVDACKDNALLKLELEQACKDNASLKLELELASKDKAALQEELDQASKDNAALKEELEQASRNNDTLKSELQQVSQQNATLKADLEQALQNNAELRTTSDRLSSQLAEQERSLITATTAIHEQQQELSRRIKAEEEQQLQLQRLSSERDSLEQRLTASCSLAERTSRSLEQLLAERANLLRKFDVLAVVLGFLHKQLDTVHDSYAASVQARRTLADTLRSREHEALELTRQSHETAELHALELQNARQQFHDDLQTVQERLHIQHEEHIQQILDQHSSEVRTLRNYNDKQVATMKSEFEKALRDAEANHDHQLEQLTSRDEQRLQEVETEHRCKLQQLEREYESGRSTYEDRIEALQADCNDLRHRVQLYEQTLQKQASVRNQIESGSAGTQFVAQGRSRHASNSESQSSGSSVSSTDSLTTACVYRPLPPAARVALQASDLSHAPRCQSVSRSLQDNTLVSYAHLEQEIASLNTVIDLRNDEIRELRRQLAEMQRVQAECTEARAKIREQQMHIENLDALLTIKTDSEKALTEKHNMLLRKYEKETKASKRLSMDYEEVRFRLEQLEETARMRAESESSSNLSSVCSTSPGQAPMTISCPTAANVFGTRHRHGSSSGIPSSPQVHHPHNRSSRPSSACSSRPRSYHAGQSQIPAPSPSGVTMRRARAGTAPPERASDSHLHSQFHSPSQLSSSAILRASTPCGEAWMIPLKEKSEDTGSSSANSNSTVNLSGPTVLQLDDTDCSYKQQSRPLTPDNGEETFENQHQLQNQLEPEPEHEPEHEPEPEAELAIETETDNTEER